MRKELVDESTAVGDGDEPPNDLRATDEHDIANATRSLMAKLEAVCSVVDDGAPRSVSPDASESPSRDNGIKHTSPPKELSPLLLNIMAGPKPPTWSSAMPRVEPAVCAAGIRQAARDRAVAQVRRALHKALGVSSQQLQRSKRYVCVFADAEVPESFFSEANLTPVGAQHPLLRVAKSRSDDRLLRAALFSPCEAAVLPPRRNSAQLSVNSFSYIDSLQPDLLRPDAMDDMYTLDQMIIGTEQDTETLQRWHANQRKEQSTLGSARGRGRRRSGLPVKVEKNKRLAAGRRRRPSLPNAETSEVSLGTFSLSPVWDLWSSAWTISWDVNEEPQQHCFFADMECATDRADKRTEADVFCRSIEYAYRRYHTLTSGLESHRVNLNNVKEVDSPSADASTAASSPVSVDLRAARRFHRAKHRAVKEEPVDRWVDLKLREFDDLKDALQFLQAVTQCEALLTKQSTIWQESLQGLDLSLGSLPVEDLRFADAVKKTSLVAGHQSVLYMSLPAEEADDLDRRLLVRPATPPPEPPTAPLLRIFAPSCPRRLLERLPIRIVSRTASTRKVNLPPRLEDRGTVRKPSPVRSAECRRAQANRRLPDGLSYVRTHRAASPRSNRRREGPRPVRRSCRSLSPSPRRRGDRKRWATSPDRRHPPHILPVPVANGPRAPKAARMV